jgi:hypothetical protein
MKISTGIVLVGVILVISQYSGGQMKPITPWNPAKAIPCPNGSGCNSFKQFVDAKDEEIIKASWACFYDKSPAEDSFFTIWDGNLAITNSGKHPSIFVQSYSNGTSPNGANGYGPMSGQNWVDMKQHSQLEFTYDDWASEFQFSTLVWGSDKADALLVGRTSTTIRKSTGRFVTTKNVFTGAGQETTTTGICLRFK